MAIKGSKQEKGMVSKREPVAAIDPFAAQVDSAPIADTKAKRPIRVRKAAPKVVSTETPSVPTRPKNADAKASEPFAEIASVSPPTKPTEILELPAEYTRPDRKKTTARRKPTAVSETAAVVTDLGLKKPRKISAKAASRTAVPVVIDESAAGTKADPTLDVTAEIAASEPAVEPSPVFKALSEVKLPELERENRARLQMQSPTRLYFYWSLRQNPWQQLRAVFGADLGSYALVVTLKNLTAGTEEISPAEPQGEWWFDVEPDAEYQAEIGFYAVNRPYFRVLYSNNVTTPRRNPSPHPASEARWTVSATKFAEVLDASGFSRDAFDVAIAGDDHLSAEHRTKAAFSQFVGDDDYSTRGISAEDLRYAMLAIAGGTSLEDLRSRVSALLFATLQSNASKLSAESAREVLTTHFDVDETEWTEEVLGSAVYGASLINFPTTLRSRRDATYSPRYNPVSSHGIGR
jgi:hypothetical protein